MFMSLSWFLTSASSKRPAASNACGLKAPNVTVSTSARPDDRLWRVQPMPPNAEFMAHATARSIGVRPSATTMPPTFQASVSSSAAAQRRR